MKKAALIRKYGKGKAWSIVRLALPERKDLVSPGECVRDSQGRVVSCYSLVSN